MSVVVIGGGLAGLNAALTLQEAGVEVELFEASDNVGGRVRTDYIDGFVLDRGFQLINDGYSEISRLRLAKEIDFIPFSRSVDVVTPMGVTTLGDPRTNPLSALRSPLGSLREKLALIKYLKSTSPAHESVEEEMVRSGLGDLYLNVLKPFLRGVFLAELATVDARYGKEIISTFLFGKSGLPRAGVGVLSEALASRIENIHLNHKITSLDEFGGKEIILATDASSADRLLGRPSESKWVTSYTWYHSLPSGVITEKNLRVSSVQSILVNSIATSNTIPDFAPEGRTLFSSTTLVECSEMEVIAELEKFWGISGFESIAGYEIEKSLPTFGVNAQRNALTSKVKENVFLAGDYLSAGSQNAALLSGRLAATELLAQLEH